MDLYVFQKFKIIAYVSYKLILHYVNICKFFINILLDLRLKHLDLVIMIILNLK